MNVGNHYQNKNGNKNFFSKHKLAIITVLLGLMIFAVLQNLDWQSISDYKKASEFTPASDMKALIDKIELTEKGRVILYASSPQLKDKVAFNGRCGRDNDPLTYVSGCYYQIDGEEYIDIYNSGKTATEIEKAFYDYDNAKAVSLAHEMMHAVYSRLGDGDKEWLKIELNKIYTNNADIREELSRYPQNQRYDELYVRAATELTGISSKLEKHYAEYFKNRINITKLYQNNKTQLSNLLKDADKLLERIEAQELVVNNTRNYYARRNAIIEYNNLVEAYNAQIGVYRRIKDKLDSEK